MSDGTVLRPAHRTDLCAVSGRWSPQGAGPACAPPIGAVAVARRGEHEAVVTRAVATRPAAGG